MANTRRGGYNRVRRVLRERSARHPKLPELLHTHSVPNSVGSMIRGRGTHPSDHHLSAPRGAPTQLLVERTSPVDLLPRVRSVALRDHGAPVHRRAAHDRDHLQQPQRRARDLVPVPHQDELHARQARARRLRVAQLICGEADGTVLLALRGDGVHRVPTLVWILGKFTSATTASFSRSASQMLTRRRCVRCVRPGTTYK